MTQTRIGKYEILEELGRGGFAVVYKARDTALDRIVALKVLHPAYGGQPEVAQRFLNEARKVAQLQHPNIVSIFDVGEKHGQLYLAMIYLPGGSLLQRLADAPMPVDTVISIVEQVAAALTYAHKKRLVHRDVKPANILFDEENRALLADFGLVKSLLESGLTIDGARLGTPAYMSPEQSGEGGDIGPATDIYALGVLVYEMLAGRVPFIADVPLAVLHAHVHTPPPDPRILNDTLHEALVAVMLRALSKDPADRYATPMVFVHALKKAWLDVQRAMQTQAALGDLYAQAQTALQARKWGLVVNLCVEIRNRDPDYRDVGALLTLAASHLAEEEEQRRRRRELAEQLAEACQFLAQKNYPAAIVALEVLTAQSPGFPGVAENLSAARAGQQKAVLYAGAQDKLHSDAYEGACADLLTLLEQDANYEDAAACLRVATAGVLEHLTAVRADLEAARVALERSQGENQDLHAHVSALGTQLAAAEAAHKRLEKAARDTERQLAAAKKSADDLETQVQQAQARVVAYDQLLLALEDRAHEQALSLAEPLTEDDLPGITRVWARLRTLAAVARARPPVEPEGDVWRHPLDGKLMARIPAGEFLYGDKKESRTLPEFWMDKTPVTNAEFTRFVEATGYKTTAEEQGYSYVWTGKEWEQTEGVDWRHPGGPETNINKTLMDHPVVHVSWQDAVAYAEWAGKRLPTEEEWEKAVRGTDGRVYPWGDSAPTPELCNFKMNVKTTTPVGRYSPQGDSPYGCTDMAGNVWEWTACDWSSTDKDKVVRGGSWFHFESYVRSTYRLSYTPSHTLDDMGFRCVMLF